MKSNKKVEADISPESDNETEDINLLLNDFKTALKKEYIMTMIKK